MPPGRLVRGERENEFLNGMVGHSEQGQIGPVVQCQLRYHCKYNIFTYLDPIQNIILGGFGVVARVDDTGDVGLVTECPVNRRPEHPFPSSASVAVWMPKSDNGGRI